MTDSSISIRDTGGGHATVTQVDGNNNIVNISIDKFRENVFVGCGLRLLNKKYFEQHSQTSENFQNWLEGFEFSKESIYYKREYRREEILSNIKKLLEDKKRVLILGESGTSKSTLIMEVMTDYMQKDYQILCYIEPDIREIENVPYMENIVEDLIAGGHNILVVIDDVHKKNKSAIFSLIQTLQSLEKSKKEKVSFLLSARQPEFDLAMDRGLFDTNIIQTINSLFEDTRKYNVPYFTQDEIVGFIEKYKDNVHISKRSKSIAEFAYEIFKDTKGHPIMVRFSVLQDGLETHVEKMYRDYLLTHNGTTSNNHPDVDRIKSFLACSLYHISSLPIDNSILFEKMDLKKPSFEINGALIQRTGDTWKTIHPRWDLEMFKHLFSLNERDRIEIEDSFKSIFLKILDMHSGSNKQLDILKTLYITIAVEQFIDIKIIQEMLKVEDIEKKLDSPYFKLFFFANIIGVTLLVLARNEEAIECFDKAIEIDPQNAWAYSLKGRTLSVLGRNKEAIECCDKAIEINPQDALSYKYKGIALSALGRNEEAIASYDKTIEINPQDALAYNYKGIILSDLGRKEEAIASYDKAIDIDPQYAEAYYNKGNALSSLGRKEEAIVCYDKAIEINPQYAEAYYNKGNALSELGRKEEAIVCYDKAIEINPQDAMVYYNKGTALSVLGRNEEAIECYDKAIEINPQDADAYYNKGTALSALGRNEEAIECYDKAIEINPQYADAYYNKGTALSVLGRNEEAIECYDKAIEINPQDAIAYFGKGSALSALGRYKEALVCDDKGLAIDPNHSDGLNGKAFDLANLGRNEEALPVIKKGLEIAPNTDYVLATAAFIMYNLERYDQAKNYYNKALDVNPNIKDTLSKSELKAFNSVV